MDIGNACAGMNPTSEGDKDALRSEAVLVDYLADLLPRCFANHGRIACLQRELCVGRRIADMVLLIGPDRLSSMPPAPFSVSECVALASLRQSGPTRIDLLERRCGVSGRGFRSGVLSRLKNWGLVTFGPGGRTALGEETGLEYLIVAIEAKLERWQGALSQAVYYQRYADLSYVALPRSFVPRDTDYLNSFRDAGVGLMLVDDAYMEVPVPAVYQDAHDWRREFAYSRLASRRDSTDAP